MSTFELGWLAAAVVLFCLWLDSRSRVTRRESWRRASARRGPALDGDTGGVVATQLLIYADGVRRVFRRRLAGDQRRVGRIAGRQAAAELAMTLLVVGMNELRTAASSLGPVTGLVTPKAAAWLFRALYLGDCAVAAGVLMAENAELPLLLALVMSLAIATAQFAVGKRAGQILVARGEGKGAWVLPLVVLVLLGLSLATLLYGIGVAWAYLAITPAVGAAALTVISDDPGRRRYHLASRHVRPLIRRCTRRVARFGRIVGRSGGSWANVAALGTQTMVAPARAEGANAGLTTADADATAGIRGIETVLEDFEIVKLRELRNGSVTRLGSMLDQLQDITTNQIAACEAAAAAARYGSFLPKGATNGHNRTRPMSTR